MKTFIQSATMLLFVAVVLMFVGILPSFAADLQMFSNVQLVKNPANDGDSFLVKANGKSFHVRLYFVDCPETSISFKSDAQRVREQTRYFGLISAERTIHFGNEAKIFVERILAKPFTLYTDFASALGRSPKGRMYGFIITADGNDLASLLVKNGFARTHGVGRKTPAGTSRDEMFEILRDMEISAILKHIGIWSESDPDRIAELRAKQRSEDQELKELQSQVKKAPLPQSLLDLNTASKKELQSIKGIGPVLAERIIVGRPYKTVDDLLKVKGISHKKLEKIRPYFVIGKK
ncbi:MAG: helix-hairpin-helix domain-containing protein [Thermodesulfovibrionales bacterium]|nr:helix-hairpin-helix domain-containing protein [Thermodesulfovibrionales bacterium]